MMTNMLYYIILKYHTLLTKANNEVLCLAVLKYGGRDIKSLSNALDDIRSFIKQWSI